MDTTAAPSAGQSTPPAPPAPLVASDTGSSKTSPSSRSLQSIRKAFATQGKVQGVSSPPPPPKPLPRSSSNASKDPVSQDERLDLLEKVIVEAASQGEGPATAPPPVQPVQQPPVSAASASPAPAPQVQTPDPSALQPQLAQPDPLQDPSVIPQAWPQAVQAADTLNPQMGQPQTTAKEARAIATPDQVSPDAAVDAGGGITTVEQERTPELPVEVEGYLHHAIDQAQQDLQEVVIADGTQGSASTQYPSTPVVVLPITEEIAKKNKRKSPKYSIRWLVEWSHKIIKMFTGKVIYQPEEED